MINLDSQTWYSHLFSEEKLLIDTSIALANRLVDGDYSDYSFVVFPMAKAYEGFLKRFFLELQLISRETYESRRFRIGRAFNPDLGQNLRDEWWIFDDVAQVCGLELAREMWQAWLECRNRVFHYFPTEHRPLSLAAAEAKLRQLIMVMEGAVRCQQQLSNRSMEINNT